MFTFQRGYSNLDEETKNIQSHLNGELDDEFLMARTGSKPVAKYTKVKISTLARKIFGSKKSQSDYKPYPVQSKFNINQPVMASGSVKHTRLTDTGISLPESQIGQYYKLREPTDKQKISSRPNNYQILDATRTN